jgi:uncharacterized membrane protein YkoI
MMMRKGLLMAGATILLGIAVLVFVFLQPMGTNDFSQSEAEAKVAKMYGGDVAETHASDAVYDIRFSREDGRFAAIVNKETGQIESVKLLEKIEGANKITKEEAASIAAKEVKGKIEDVAYSKERNEYEVTIADGEKRTAVIVAAENGEVRNVREEAAAPEPERVISQKEAIDIAKKTLDGEASDVEFVDTEDGGYYLVDIEKDETDQEVRVQIHAIRGETMTVEWDD